MLAPFIINHLSSGLLSKNVRIAIQRIVMLPIVSRVWISVSDIEGSLLRVFKNRSPRKIFGPEGGGSKRRLDKSYNEGLH